MKLTNYKDLVVSFLLATKELIIGTGVVVKDTIKLIINKIKG